MVVDANPAAAAEAGLQVNVLSNRADLISGGDALVAVDLPTGVDPQAVRVTAGGKDVTTAFAMRPNGKFEGLVRGLPVGPTVLRATGGGSSDQLTVVNHPNGGPVLSGPQPKVWRCQPAAVDKQCNQPASYEYFYRSGTPGSSGFKPYDPDNPPSDVASTTTDEGVRVPFVIRVETGYQDRDQYQIATLFQPGKPWRPWAPQQQWNHKVLATHGGGCGIDYASGSAPAVTKGSVLDAVPLLDVPLPVAVPLDDSPQVALSRGFAVMSTALNNTGHNCSQVMNAESMMMAKERLVEQYGEIRYTIGTGCSGGSIAQQTVANAYPGIYQGLIVTCSYPDSASPGAQFFDYHLLRKYFEAVEPLAKGWTPLQWGAVEGHLLPLNAVVADEGLFKPAFNPTTACGGVSDQQRYHPENNPGGVRCGVLDALISQFGPRVKSVWSDNERRIGRGFAGMPIDNVGVQYGLQALRSGVITPDQFVDLNRRIGGLDIDAQHQAERTVADQPALRNMYRDGWLNSASNLANVAIIDHGGPDPGLAHDARWAWSMRDRLDREQGHHDNHVIWFGQFPIIGDPNYSTEALLAMDRWLTAVEEDDRDVPVADKIVQDRPGDIRDRCSQVQGLSSKDGLNIPVASPLLRKLLGPALNPVLDGLNSGLNPVLDPALRLVVDPVLNAVCGAGIVGETLRTDFDTPRGVAGQSNTSDDHKCRLKPLNRNDDYGPVKLTDAQWAELSKTFPHGACDYSKPGAGKQDTVTWLSYQDCHGKVIYGGQPLGSAPRNSGDGWNSRAFDGWQQAGERGEFGSCPAAKPGSGSSDEAASTGGTAGGGQPAAAGAASPGGGAATPATAATGALASTGNPVAVLVAVAAWLLTAGLLTGRFARRRSVA